MKKEKTRWFGIPKLFPYLMGYGRLVLADMIALGFIASNANIGGPTTAAGMAISQGWTRLVGPAMLVGVLGYVIGNYAGTIVGIILGA